MSGSDGYARPGVAGSGTIACSLAACASRAGEVRLLARSDASAWRAEESAQAESDEQEAKSEQAAQGAERAEDQDQGEQAEDEAA